jgi:hypothetical protein
LNFSVVGRQLELIAQSLNGIAPKETGQFDIYFDKSLYLQIHQQTALILLLHFVNQGQAVQWHGRRR